MYFLRIAGAAVLVFSGFLCSHIMNSALSKKFEQIEALIMLMRFIKIQIECFGLPASEIIERCDKNMLFLCGMRDGENIPNNFEQFFKYCDVRDKETKDILLAFASGFGKGYRAEQIKECDYYLELLCDRRERIYDELPKQKKINSTLCVSSVLAVVILLF